ncbi:MAG TPA: hypothetical protein VNJ08_10585 [Bacteriovoracaceae bacterium]|nr:hypothetical protein [Bacteriovoracaceae bacterium]
MNHFKSLFVFSLTLFVGCSSFNKSMGLGGAIGVGSGAIIGGLADPGKDGKFRTRNVVIGSVIGGALGAAAGGVINQKSEKEKAESYEKAKSQIEKEQLNSREMPNLKSPKVEARWIEGRTVGNRYIAPHYEYIITEPARWEEE